METSVWLALIGMGSLLITSTMASVIAPIVQSRAARKQKLEDYARQDVVAAQAAESSRAAAERQEKAASLLLAANERVAASTESTKVKLEEVKVLGEKTHALSNSNLTAVMKLALNASERELSSMMRELSINEELISLKRAAGHDPSPEAITVIAGTRADIATLGERIIEMRAAVDARLKQQEIDNAKNV